MSARMVLVAAIAWASLQPVSGQPPLAFAAAIALPGVEGRIDHLAFDGDTRRMFVAALGNDTVEVLDVTANRHVKSLRGFHSPQGIAVTADAMVVANGRGEGAQFV